MNENVRRLVRLAALLAGLLIAAWALTGQAARRSTDAGPLPTDWTHRHVIFSQPSTPEAFARVKDDIRYWQQLARQSRSFARGQQGEGSSGPPVFSSSVFTSRRKMHRDWSVNMGSGATPGAGNFPAKFGLSGNTANCATDYVVFSTGLTGTAGQANIVAYNNLYSGCGGTVPSVYWAYNITSAQISSGQILTSPVLSRDGSQIAFVQENGTFASLVLLKWAASSTETVGSPDTPTAVLPAAYQTCTAPCMTAIDLRSGLDTLTHNIFSSVFYNYGADIAWVGDSQGWLHQFTGVFKGIPTEVRTGGFPVQMPGNTALSSPVFDRLSNNIFVGDLSGFLYRVDASSAATVQSAQLDFVNGLVSGPIVDTTAGIVYESVSADGSGACSGGTADCAGVFQFPTNFTTGAKGTEAVVGTSTSAGVPTPNVLYDGFFDNQYIFSGNATGNYYICGNTGANPTLFVVPIQAGVMQPAAPVATLTGPASTAACSPVTDVFAPGTAGNAATERLFVSVQSNSLGAGCGGGGCIQSLIDTPWQASTAFSVGQEILVNSSGPLTFVAVQAGTTGATQPNWPSTAGVTKNDGGVVWLNQGNPATPISPWQATHSYSTVGGRIVDSNGNVEVIQTAGTSGASHPVWATTPGTTTPDGTGLVWINAGAYPFAAFPAPGGTCGIIVDNIVPPGTLAGASQVYFTPLKDEVCTTSGTVGGCAIQASQQALQ